MIILLYGPDDYRREEKKKELVAEFTKKHSQIGVGRFDLIKEGELARFRNFIENQSIFEPAKLALLENSFAQSDKEFLDIILSVTNAPQTFILFSEREKPPKNLAFLEKGDRRTKTKPALVQKFEHLTERKWESFIQREAKQLNVVLTAPSLRFLALAYNGDTWRLITELQKLSFLSKKTIDVTDLERLDIELTPNFWELVNNLKSQRLYDRMAALEKLLEAEEPAAKIFSIAAYQAKGKLRTMAAYDTAVKSGKLDYEEILVALAIS